MPTPINYTFPAITPKTSSLRKLTNTKTFVSPLSGFTQSGSRDGNRWGLRMNYVNLSEDDRGELDGFIAQLNGQVNRANIRDHAYLGARGTVGGAPVVDGNGQTGLNLVTRAWNNTELVLKRGDKFSFTNGTNNEIKIVTADSSSNGSGQLTIPIWPEIHSSPTDGATIVTSNPTSTFILVGDAEWTNEPSQNNDVATISTNVTLVFVEDIAA